MYTFNISRRIRIYLGMFVVITALLLSGASPSFAVSDSAVVDGQEVIVPLRPENTNGIQPLGVLPGCYGKLDRVHISSQAPALASAHGRTVCPGSSRNYVSLSIGYTGWFGERYGVRYNSRSGSWATIDTQVKTYCAGKGVQTWRAFGYRSSLKNGTTYYANTSKDGRFSC